MRKMDNEIKKSIEEIKPDFYMKTRLAAKIIESEKPKRTFKFKGICTALLAFILVMSVGFGINYFTNNKTEAGSSNINDEYNSSSTSRVAQDGIMIAYAGTTEPVHLDELKVSQMPIFYNITIIDSNAPDDEIQKKRDKYNKIKNSIQEQAETIGKTGKGIGIRSGSGTTDNYSVLQCSSGEFMLDLDDYTNVSKLTISNSNKLAQIYFHLIIEEVSEPKISISNIVYATGEELAASQKTGWFSRGLGENEINKGYEIYWDVSPEFYDELENNPDFEISRLKDSITFEVDYKNGDTTKATVNISFDKDGNMILENGGFDYYTAE